MPAKTLKDWVEGHGPSKAERIAKRLERFSGNTGDTATGAAAAELVAMIRDAAK